MPLISILPLHNNNFLEIFLRLLETKFDLFIMDEMFLSQQAVIAYRLRERFGTKFVILFTTGKLIIYYFLVKELLLLTFF